MLRFAVSAAALAALGTAAVAEEPLVLWQNLHVGMTKAEVKAAQPVRAIALSPGCGGTLSFTYKDGRLTEVVMENGVGDDGTRQCGVVIHKSLFEKYGQPESDQTQTVEHDCGDVYAKGLLGALARACADSGGNNPTHQEVTIWEAGGVEVAFTGQLDDGNKAWTLHYRASPIAAPSAASKL